MGEYKRVIPPAKSLITGLRSMGYSFASAIADIIDNSISARAKHISIVTDPHAISPYLAIFDDGCGMGKEKLKNAMTIGSDRSDKEDSLEELGRFGLGMKTASFSQCLRLTVASKDSSHINAMRYDIDEIKENNDWLLMILDDDEIEQLPEIDRLKNAKTGTLVIWEKFDTIESEAENGKFVDAFNAAVRSAEEHIAFVFHRFYDDIEINVEGHRVERRDPFLVGHKKTQEGREKIIQFNGQDIVVKPYVLPNTHALTKEEKQLLGNPRNVSDDQGIYLYRNKRLISWGTWLRMNARSEFNKLSRVLVDIPSSLDEVWSIDVKKSSARIPEAIKELMKTSIKDANIKSEREVRYRGKKESEAKTPVWTRLVKPDGTVKYEVNHDYPLLETIMQSMTPEQRKTLDVYLERVERYIPIGLITDDERSTNVTFSDMGNEQDLDALEYELIQLINTCYHGSIEILDSLIDSQGFDVLRERRSEIVEKLRDDTARN